MSTRKLTLSHLAEEPFRIFFPLALATGCLGVLLWPLHFSGILPVYPGAGHARLMAHGFFGGFMLGFLGTALPRMLSAPSFKLRELCPVLLCYLAMIFAHACAWTRTGDILFISWILLTLVLAATRLRHRADVPPPGFVMVPLAFACGLAGALIALLEPGDELPLFWLALRPLLQFQGFVLLPILGVGAFFLPRLFDLPNRHTFPESTRPPPGWLSKAGWSLLVAAAVIATFPLEAAGWFRASHLLRFTFCAAWLLHEVPMHRMNSRGDILASGVRWAVGLLLLGYLAEVFFPEYRVALLHLVLMGGFGVITLSVATRVVYGHTGNRDLLRGKNRWFTLAVILMLVGMVSRVSGDLWPAIRVSHYNYGALLWVIGAIVWGWKVLPKVRFPDPEE